MADVIQLPATPPSIPEELKLWIQCQVKTQRERKGGDNGLFITLVPKFYYNVSLFVGLTTLGNFIEI